MLVPIGTMVGDIGLESFPAPFAPEPETVLLEGSDLRGLGPIQSLEGLAIDNAGRCLMLAEFGGDSDHNECLLLDGTPVLLEGEGVRGRLGLTIAGLVTPFPAESRNLEGFPLKVELPWIAELGGTEAQMGGTGLFWGARPLALPRLPCRAVGLDRPSRWRGFRGLTNRGKNTLFVARITRASSSSLDSPSGTALFRLAWDADHSPVFERLLVAGDSLFEAGTTRLLRISEHPRGLAASASGDWVVAATLRSGKRDMGALLRSGQLALRDLDACTPQGARAHAVDKSVVALDDRGRLAWIGELVERDSLPAKALVVDGRPMAREGYGIAAPGAIGGELQSFGIGAPLVRAPDGRVLWFGRFDAREARADTAIFLGSEVLVREGDRTGDGMVLDVLFEHAGAFALSPDGRWLVFGARLVNGVAGIFRLELGAVATTLGPDGGAYPLRLLGGRTAPGFGFDLELIGQGEADSPFEGGRLLMSEPLRKDQPPRSQGTAWGELWIDPTRAHSSPGTAVEGGRRVLFRVEIPPDGFARGESVVLQAVGLGPGGELTLSQAVLLSF